MIDEIAVACVVTIGVMLLADFIFRTSSYVGDYNNFRQYVIVQAGLAAAFLLFAFLTITRR